MFEGVKEITVSLVLEKMEEILAKRGKKGTNTALLVSGEETRLGIGLSAHTW